MRSIAAALFFLAVTLPSLAMADAPAPPPATDAKAKPKKAELMDINTATADQLKTLPGITDEIAGKIIAGRPYKGKDALLKQKMVDKDGYAKIRELIIAKQAKKEAAPAKTAAPAPAPKSAAPKNDAVLGGAPAAAPPSGAH